MAKQSLWLSLVLLILLVYFSACTSTLPKDTTPSLPSYSGPPVVTSRTSPTYIAPSIPATIPSLEQFPPRHPQWVLEDGWKIITIEDQLVLLGQGHSWIWLAGESWSNYTFKSRIRIGAGTLHLNYRFIRREGRSLPLLCGGQCRSTLPGQTAGRHH
jgi:hypothetical protein